MCFRCIKTKYGSSRLFFFNNRVLNTLRHVCLPGLARQWNASRPMFAINIALYLTKSAQALAQASSCIEYSSPRLRLCIPLVIRQEDDTLFKRRTPRRLSTSRKLDTGNKLGTIDGLVYFAQDVSFFFHCGSELVPLKVGYVDDFETHSSQNSSLQFRVRSVFI